MKFLRLSLIAASGALISSVLALVVSASVYSQAAPRPAITLRPSSGFAATTVYGTDFPPYGTAVVYWDGNPIQNWISSSVSQGDLGSVPAFSYGASGQPVQVGADGTFTAIIELPSAATPGTHAVTIASSAGNATSPFQVVSRIGPPGIGGAMGLQGLTGLSGPQGPSGPTGATTIGPAGPQGEQGPVGPTGPQGPTGDQGPSGQAGPAGAPGAAPTAFSGLAIFLALAAIALAFIGTLKKLIFG